MFGCVPCERSVRVSTARFEDGAARRHKADISTGYSKLASVL